VERSVIIWTFLAYALTGLLLVLLGMVMDYGKIALIAEQRRSAIGSFFRGLRFVLRNPRQCLGLYTFLLLVSAAVLAFWMLIAPGAGQSSLLTIGLAFVAGQIYLLARIGVKLWFLGSQTSLFASLALTSPGPVADPQPSLSASITEPD
jgi:hypothetical protein